MNKPTDFRSRLSQTRSALREAKSVIEQAKKKFKSLQESLKALDADTSLALYSALVVSQHARIQFETLQDKLNNLEPELARLRAPSTAGTPAACESPERTRQVVPAKKSQTKTILEWAKAILAEKDIGMSAGEIAERAEKRGYQRKRGAAHKMRTIAETFRTQLDRHPDEFYKDELKKYHLRSTFRSPSGSTSGN